MSDIFRDMQSKLGCRYISDLPDQKRVVWYELRRMPLAGYGEKQLEDFARKAGNVVFVSDNISSDAMRYDESTETYRRLLAQIDRRLARVCDVVAEVNAGQVTVYKGAWRP